jgi:hypothetical protein
MLETTKLFLTFLFRPKSSCVAKKVSGSVLKNVIVYGRGLKLLKTAVSNFCMIFVD